MHSNDSFVLGHPSLEQYAGCLSQQLLVFIWNPKRNAFGGSHYNMSKSNTRVTWGVTL